MKLQVYEPTTTKKEVIVRLKLGADGNDVTVIAVDEDGDRVDAGTLLTFKSNGTILRMHYVSDELGFAVDDKGRIEFEDE